MFTMAEKRAAVLVPGTYTGSADCHAAKWQDMDKADTGLIGSTF